MKDLDTRRIILRGAIPATIIGIKGMLSTETAHAQRGAESVKPQPPLTEPASKPLIGSRATSILVGIEIAAVIASVGGIIYAAGKNTHPE